MRIDLVAPDQHESLVDLLCELHAYYNNGSSVSRDLVKSHLTQNLLAPDSGLRLVVASGEGNDVLGFGAITLTYSLVEPEPGRRRQCWLKELYVRESHRNAGVGEALMVWIARYALDQGCCRIDWPVKASNARGIRFYEGLGATLVEDRLGYRLTEPHLSGLAMRSA